MSTVNSLVEEAAASLRGYVRNQEQVTYLTADCTESDTTLTVGNGARISAGRIAIGDEILEVDSIDGNTVNIFPFGRGADGSTAAAHTANDRVVANPLFPRYRVRLAVEESIKSVATMVPAVATTEFTFNPGTYSVNLPADVAEVLNVQGEQAGLTNTWTTINRYRVDKFADETAFAGGNSLVVLAGAFPGKKVQVTYTKTAPALLTDATDVVADLGLRPTLRDVITLGAVARLLSMVDISTLDPSSVQALFVDEKRQPGSTTRIVSQLWALYRERLDEEKNLFMRQNPARIHFER